MFSRSKATPQFQGMAHLPLGARAREIRRDLSKLHTCRFELPAQTETAGNLGFEDEGFVGCRADERSAKSRFARRGFAEIPHRVEVQGMNGRHRQQGKEASGESAYHKGAMAVSERSMVTPVPRLELIALRVASRVGQRETEFCSVARQPRKGRAVREIFFQRRRVGAAHIHGACAVVFAESGCGASPQNRDQSLSGSPLGGDNFALPRLATKGGKHLQDHSFRRGRSLHVAPSRRGFGA